MVLLSITVQRLSAYFIFLGLVEHEGKPSVKLFVQFCEIELGLLLEVTFLDLRAFHEFAVGLFWSKGLNKFLL